jgi:hypothetical protein
MDMFDKVTEDGEDLFSVFDSSNPVTKKRTAHTSSNNNNNETPKSTNTETSVRDEWIADVDSAPKQMLGMKGVYTTSSTKKPKVDGTTTESIESRLAKEDAIALIGKQNIFLHDSN